MATMLGHRFTALGTGVQGIWDFLCTLIVRVNLKMTNFCFQRMYKLTHISKYWGPALPQHRAKVKHLKNFEIDPHGFSDVGPDSKVSILS